MGGWGVGVGLGDHPSFKLGVLISVCVHGNGQCYAQFDSKADRVKRMATNSCWLF